MSEFIQSAHYLENGAIELTTVEGEVLQVPDDPKNRHRALLTDWEDAGNEIAPFTVSLEEAQASAKRKIIEHHAQILQRLTGSATVEERDTWMPKAMAAEAILSGSATDFQTAMISTEAELAGETTNELAQKIAAKYAAYQSLIGMASGLKRKTENAIELVENAEDVDGLLAAAVQQSDQFIQQWLTSQNA